MLTSVDTVAVDLQCFDTINDQPSIRDEKLFRDKAKTLMDYFSARESILFAHITSSEHDWEDDAAMTSLPSRQETSPQAATPQYKTDIYTECKSLQDDMLSFGSLASLLPSGGTFGPPPEMEEALSSIEGKGRQNVEYYLLVLEGESSSAPFRYDL